MRTRLLRPCLRRLGRKWLRRRIWPSVQKWRPRKIQTNPNEKELQKLKNKAESTLIFSETGALNKVLNLSYFEVLGNADLINEEVNLYNNITLEDLQRVACKIFVEENCSEVYYRAKKPMSE